MGQSSSGKLLVPILAAESESWLNEFTALVNPSFQGITITSAF